MERGAIIKHNLEKSPKTGDWKYMTPEVDKDKCIGCQNCMLHCPDACIEMMEHGEDAKKKADIDLEFCKGCGVCAQVCPVKAIIMKK